MRRMLAAVAAMLALAPAAAQETRIRPSLNPAEASRLRPLIRPSDNEARWEFFPGYSMQHYGYDESKE